LTLGGENRNPRRGLLAGRKTALRRAPTKIIKGMLTKTRRALLNKRKREQKDLITLFESKEIRSGATLGG